MKDKTTGFSGRAVIAATVLAGLWLPSSLAEASQQFSESDMPRFCQGEAAGRFNTKPAHILTLPLEQNPSGYVVYGQYPESGPDVSTFECQFNGAGEFVKLTVSGEPSAPAGPAPGAVAEADMGRYCQGEAAGTFNTKPRYVLTLPVERSGHGYVVGGQYPDQGNDVTTFECRFDRAGMFKGVHVDAPRSSAPPSGDVVAEADMPRFCAGEASAAFGVSPRDITPQRAIHGKHGYAVLGTYKREGKTTIFSCRFDEAGAFRSVQ